MAVRLKANVDSGKRADELITLRCIRCLRQGLGIRSLFLTVVTVIRVKHDKCMLGESRAKWCIFLQPSQIEVTDRFAPLFSLPIERE